MISMLYTTIHQDPTDTILKGLFQNVYAKFLLFLKQKSISLSTLPREITISSLATSFIMYLPLNETQIDVFCKIVMKWSNNYQMLSISVSYKISKIGGVKISQVNNRTRIELISSLSQVNQYLKDRQSCLTISYDQFDSFTFQAKQTIVTTIKKGVLKQFIASILEKAFLEFFKYFKELNEVDFFTAKTKNTKFLSLRQLLENLYISKAKLIITHSKKHQQSIKNCLTFILANARQQNSAFQQFKQSNIQASKKLNYKQIKLENKETIGSPIKIHQIQEAFEANCIRFHQNLQKNKAVTQNSQSITLKKISFQLRKSFGQLRENKQGQINHYFPIYEEDHTIFNQHVVFKRCMQLHKNKQSLSTSESTSNKSKEELGHINEHNFLMTNANLKCPYIGKYYLNINQSPISNIAKRTIITKMQAGDLFTQVAYKTYNRLHQFQFIEYLTIFEQLAKAVCFLHQNNIVHRDIKPTNVLFKFRSTNNFVCKLIDFGSCFARRQDSSHMFNPKVFTTPRFNLTYKNALKATKNEIGKQFSQDSYQSHELFDIYGIAETLSYLLTYSTLKYQFQCLDMIINICKHPDPNLRFTPQELLILIQHLKLNVIASSCQHLLNNNQGNASYLQNN